MRALLIASVIAAATAGCSEESEWEARAEAISDIDCSEARVCGDLAYVDCHSEVDGPSYYFDRVSGDLISTCGGACFVPSEEQLEVCQTLCPPPQWTCAR